MSGRYWSTTEVAKVLGLSKPTVLAMFKRGEIPGAQRLSGSRSYVVIPSDAVVILKQRRIEDIDLKIKELEELRESIKATEVV